MSRTVTIRNAELCAAFSTRGAELISLKDEKNNEFIWQGDAKTWDEHAPILFPLCSGLLNGEIRLGGKPLHLPKHGFAKQYEFSLIKEAPASLTFRLTDSEETRKIYPFAFSLDVTYTLEGGTLAASYRVENKSGETMYYSIGAHEGYALPEGVDGYEVCFEKDEQFESNLLTPDYEGILHETEHIGEGKVLPLRHEYFKIDALIFTSLSSRSLTLRKVGGGREIFVEYPDADVLLLWQVEGAPFLCVEPWAGAPDFDDRTGNIEDKAFIRAVPAGGVQTFSHRITPKM